MKGMERFFWCDSGAVTVEWVVLTAVAAALAASVGAYMNGPVAANLEQGLTHVLQQALAQDAAVLASGGASGTD